EPLADLRTVGVGGIDESHAQLERPSQHPPALLWVLRLSPDARARETHRPEAEPVDGEVAAEVDPARVGDGGRGPGPVSHGLLPCSPFGSVSASVARLAGDHGQAGDRTAVDGG